jgi:hypothetical protein
MSSPNHTDDCRRYWASVADGGRRRQVEHAAADPLGRWLTADAPALVDDDVGIDPDHLRGHPDAVLAALRQGLLAYVEDADLDGHRDDRYGYEVLPVHVTAVGRVEGARFDLGDPVADANTLTTVRDAAVDGTPRRAHEAAIRTYRCPLGHRTTVRQPRFRSWALDTCGQADCTNAVVLDDTATRARPVARFTVSTASGSLPCLAAGKYAAADEEFDRLAGATRLHLTGIPRLVTDETGTLEPTFEVLSAEPTSP